MKGLKKIALASAIAAVSVGAQAELKALDDSAMGELTGQAGLTIDIETKWSIGEFAYEDAGFVVLKDLAMGGNSNEAASPFFAAHNGMLDNIRLTLDVAGSGVAGDNVSAYGFSEVKGLAAVHAQAGAAAEFGAAAAGFGQQAGLSVDSDTGLRIDDERVSNDGDLTLHFGFTDAWQKGGGYLAYANGLGSDGAGGTTDLTNLSWDVARATAANAVDFQFDIGQIALADSTYGSAARLGTEVISKTDHATGADQDAGGATTTTLISDLSMKGYLGPMDIIIENNGNGFAGNGPAGAGTGDANSKILWDSFFKVTDLDLYIDIAGVQLSDIQIHNTRGDLGSLNMFDTGAVDASGNPILEATSSFGFAHSKREIYAVKDAVLNLSQGGLVDGIAINTEFKGDIDIGAISFGNTGTSIGSIYMTDVESTTNWTISAH